MFVYNQAVRRTTSAEFARFPSLIFLFSSSRLIFVDGGSINSNVFDWRDGIFSARNFRISAKVRLRSILIHIGCDRSGKRKRIVVDNGEVFNRFSANCSRRLASGVIVVVVVGWVGTATDGLNWPWPVPDKPTVWPVPPNGLNVGATRLYSSWRQSSRRT